MPRSQRKAPQTETAMIRRAEIQVRLSKMTSMHQELKAAITTLSGKGIPFHPAIFVFSTGQVSREDCVPMERSPMPKVGFPFHAEFCSVLNEAIEMNPSVHDGAMVFSRRSPAEPYHLVSWSMRIVSKHLPLCSKPNLGSAYNSALSLSQAECVDICCIVGMDRITFFECGCSYSELKGTEGHCSS